MAGTVPRSTQPRSPVDELNAQNKGKDDDQESCLNIQEEYIEVIPYNKRRNPIVGRQFDIMGDEEQKDYSAEDEKKFMKNQMTKNQSQVNSIYDTTDSLKFRQTMLFSQPEQDRQYQTSKVKSIRDASDQLVRIGMEKHLELLDSKEKQKQIDVKQ